MTLSKLYLGDCLELMREIPTGTVDFICADLPYGITNCAWDRRIDLGRMWQEFLRVGKENAAIALFAAGKFLIELAASNLKMYRYKWVWEKNLAVGFLNAKKMPLRAHEDILIFYRKLPTYNPQGLIEINEVRHSNNKGRFGTTVRLAPWQKKCETYTAKYTNYPTDVLKFKALPSQCKNHTSEKPVALLEYIIKTYSNEGEVVLDPVMGSGSCGVASIQTGRKFIGMELDAKYFDIAAERIAEAEGSVQLKIDN